MIVQVWWGKVWCAHRKQWVRTNERMFWRVLCITISAQAQSCLTNKAGHQTTR